MYTKLPNGKIVYAEDISCVLDAVGGKGGIFISNLEAAQNPRTLQKHGIKAVLTASKGTYLDHPKSEIPFYLYIAGEDRQGFDMSQFFPQSVDFIANALESTNVLVHCLAGVSRSVSLVIAYLIKCKNMTYDRAYQMLKAKRSIIHPNDGFISQLRKYERQCLKNSSPSKNDFRGYSASPTKHRFQYAPSTYQRKNDYLDHQKYYPESPTKRKVNFYPESPTKKPQFNYLERYNKPNTNEYPAYQYKYQNENFRSRKYNQFDNPERQLPKRNYHLEMNQRSYASRGRINSDLKFDQQKYSQLAKNRLQQKDFSDLNAELDEKIAKIRKKYAEYAEIDSPTKNRQLKCNNYMDQNDTSGISQRRITAQYNEAERNYGVMKRNYQRPTGLGIRKLNSMKDY